VHRSVERLESFNTGISFVPTTSRNTILSNIRGLSLVPVCGVILPVSTANFASEHWQFASERWQSGSEHWQSGSEHWQSASEHCQLGRGKCG
jgi:hypothetical protein